MKDVENPNIEYRQASLAQIAIFILFIVLLFLGFAILTMYLISVAKEDGFAGNFIICLILDIYILLSLVLNIFVLTKIIKFKYDDHPALYIVLTFISINIPCGIMMLIKRNQELEEE